MLLKYRRPSINFVVTSVSEELTIEQLQRSAGLPAVRREILMRRFYTFVSFLQQVGLTTRTVFRTPLQVNEYSQLCNRDLTAEGYEFVQAVYGKWLTRMGRDMGDPRERVLLSGWLRQFRCWAGSVSRSGPPRGP